jgi:hypothetical protein
VGVSFFLWAVVFVGLMILAAAALALMGLRLWRQLKELGREAARGGESLAGLHGVQRPG